jgi:di/tricarboxylate transporter
VTLAWISLAALVATLVLSCTSRLNPGVIALALAFVVGVLVGPWAGKPVAAKELLASFPSDLFITLVGVTLLFGAAQLNGTLEQVARLAERACRGRGALVPVAFFALALVLSSVGAGAIAASALVAPLGMASARRCGGSPFVMTLAVAHGAVAGGMSPFAMTGIIAGKLMIEMGLSNFQWQLYLDNLLANATVAAAAYLAVELWRWMRPASELPQHDGGAADPGNAISPEQAADVAAGAHPFRAAHAITLAVLGFLVAGVIGFQMHVGLAAFAGAALLAVFRQIDEGAALRAVPWNVILMVCGVTILVGVLEATGGVGLFTRFLVGISTRDTVNGVLALVTGLVSIYSSTSGVVLPVFLPTAPDLVRDLGGGNVLSLCTSMVIGSNLVDVSPLSTIGALCIAAVPSGEARQRLFNQMIAWGVAMSAVAGGLCLLFLE